MSPSTTLKEQYRNAANFLQRLTLHRRFGTNRYGWYRWVFEQIELTHPPRILELGCGPGALWKRNLALVPQEAFVVLSDFSSGMLDDCVRNLGPLTARVRLCRLDAAHQPFRDGSFDTVVANLMLYHVSDRANALRDIRRILTVDGRLYATTQGRGSMRELNDAAWQILGVSGRTSAADSFGLETGYDQLREVFTRVECRRYETQLRVTEAQPLLDYYQSMKPMVDAPPERWSALFTFFAQAIARDGEIAIPIDLGMLIASN
jgi:ubiquinone/menaquinone biosynthesis C-methylase UbiE